MIRRVYGDKVKMVVMPDVKSINIGRKVGYDVNRIDPPEHIEKISGTNIRAGRDDNIPGEVRKYIDTLGSTLWLTGLPCAGKTKIEKRVKEEMDNHGYRVMHLDGDDVRDELNSDPGFSDDDRKENLRRVAHIARLFNKNGNFVIASFVSPTDEMREMVSNIIGNLKLCFVKCSLEACEKRDCKGLYAKARSGEIKEFTGVSAPFEEPKDAELVVDTEVADVESCVDKILKYLEVRHDRDKT
jgi:adenylylsulfate kinase